MKRTYPKPVNGKCWCERDHPPMDGPHRVDTSDPEWPMGNPSCVCGGGAWGVPHHS